jgi:PTS system nitrogen regulatory IIA component
VLESAARLLAVPDDEETVTAQVFERLLERERLGSTGLAGGVALPHARMPGLENSRGAFIRLAEPVEFDALDGEAVDLVFALLVPEEANEEHLQLLAQLASRFNDAELRERLRSASADEALRLLSSDTPDHAA